MAQHDYVIANGTGAAVRSDLNNALAAIVSQNSGATEPATTYAFQFWADTTTGTLKLRNSANSAWIELLQLDGTLTMEDGTEALPGLSFRNDLDTGLWRPGTNQLAISTNAVERVEFGASEVVFNDGGANYDFRVEGDTNANLLFVDASADAVGIGTSAVTNLLHLRSDSASAVDHLYLQNRNGGASSGARIAFSNGTVDYTDNRYAYIGALNTGATENGNVLVFATNANGQAPVERMRLTATGLGIGTTSPGALLHAAGTIRAGASDTTDAVVQIGAGGTGSRNAYLDLVGDTTYTSYGLRVIRNNSGANASSQLLHRGTGNLDILAQEAAPIVFWTSTSEKARIDSSGRLLVGTSSALSVDGNAGVQKLQITSTSNNASLSISRFANVLNGSDLTLAKSRGASVGTNTVVAADDTLGTIRFTGADGTGFIEAVRIRAEVDGTPGTNDMPGRLMFSTTADGASSPTERMRINSGGEVLFGTTSLNPGIGNNTIGCSVNGSGYASFARNDTALYVARTAASDGNMIEFYRNAVLEGSISVSGSTVSYNGAHLSRWSQLPSGAQRIEILRGTVLSNIDEMCEWDEQDNEQLNRMKVSDIEGDKNVSGVFDIWDDDDDTYTNDFYCAMTGDFIIRIAEGVTVERGDLLMSAGDGTAKPQDDDIIRSKTIAKVTSTNVSCTYDDGSYCVPCVLMAC